MLTKKLNKKTFFLNEFEMKCFILNLSPAGLIFYKGNFFCFK